MSRWQSPRHILITGASSGLGEALALAYASSGVRLALTGRDGVRLERVAFACRERGARVSSAVLDVTDAPALKHWIEAQDEALPLDLAIANAGISEATVSLEREVEAATRALFATNVDGVFNTVLPLLGAMKERRAGRIVLMSSLAATGPLPGGVAAHRAAPAMEAKRIGDVEIGEGNNRVQIRFPGKPSAPIRAATSR